MNMLALRVWLWYAPLSFVVAIFVGRTQEWAVATLVELCAAVILIWDFEYRHWRPDSHAGQTDIDANNLD